jgi:3D (Asp-Asp-Asp) domain-containing protein
MKSLFGGSAALAATLLAGSALFYAQPLLAETISASQQIIQQEKKQATRQEQETTAQTELVANMTETVSVEEAETPVAPAEQYTATAYAFRGRTASGRPVAKGIIAADPRVLPLGTRVRVEAGTWSGLYTVADTGGAVRGRKIDIWVPTTREAFRFGRRKIKLTVLSYGGRRNNRATAKKS